VLIAGQIVYWQSVWGAWDEASWIDRLEIRMARATTEERRVINDYRRTRWRTLGEGDSRWMSASLEV
jgi:hypothetical protein